MVTWDPAEIPVRHAIRWFKCKLKPPKKEKHGGNEKAFLEMVNTESFEVWDQLP